MDDNNQDAQAPQTPTDAPEESETPAGAINIPVETPEDEPSITSLNSSEPAGPTPFASASEPAKKSKAPLIFTSVVVLVAIITGVCLYLFRDKIFNKNASGDPNDTQTTIIYSTPTDSEDPEADYVAFLEKQISAAKTSAEKLSATLNLADHFLQVKETARAIALMDSFTPSTFETDNERYAYYNEYYRIYSPAFLNQPEQAAEYKALADQYNPYKGYQLDDDPNEGVVK